MITITIQGNSSMPKPEIAKTIVSALKEIHFENIKLEMPEDRYLRDCIKGFVKDDEVVVKIIMEKPCPGKPM